jgi:hypothetical protein
MLRISAVAACAGLTLFCADARAADHPDFSGTWTFAPARSRDVGMMADAAITSVVRQSKDRLVVDDASVFGGKTYAEHTVYDLTGAPSSNTSPTMGPSVGRSRWDGARLITDWERQGALAGSVQHRLEARSLSADGRVMTLESERPGKPPMVMVFERR